MGQAADKEAIVRNLMADQRVDALLLQRISSFAWATDGAASYVSTAAEHGEASLLYTPNGRYVITNNIEAPRLRDEEGLEERGWTLVIADWWAETDEVSQLTAGMRLASDGLYPGASDLSARLSRVRASLSPQEGERFKELGVLCARAMSAVAPRIEVGMSEYEIAALLADETLRLGVVPIVQQVAVDERASAVRHAIPSHKKLSRYALVSLCGRKYGLVASLSRAMHFGPVPSDLSEKHRAVAGVDAALIRASQPHASLREVFARGQSAYSQCGYAREWRYHHQGGAAGYEPREYLGSPSASDVLKVGQAFAWNPSIRGTKSEDTVLVGEAGAVVLTATEAWPTISVEVDGQAVSRSGILEL